ncbi:MAG TPA: chemotaxis protein CheW [Oscillospiraceae bacterium]|nr:chemotaxis protein CheW [Oscillospiraceae bacterium]
MEKNFTNADSLDNTNSSNTLSGKVNETDGKYLSFWTDSQLFGIPIADVVQIVGIQKITQVPEYPTYAKGIINMRGNIIPVIDIRLRLHKQEIPYNERTCIIVINIMQKLIGLIVDSVEEVAKFSDEDISQPPKVAKSNTDSFLTGIAKSQNIAVLLLDPEKILTNEL